MNNEIEQPGTRPDYINQIHAKSKALVVKEYIGDADCKRYITIDEAINICEEALQANPVENRDSQPNQQFCEWNYFDYPDNDLCFQPSCEQGKDNPFEFTNEFPKEYKFCHCCGKPIKIIEPPKDEDDSQN